MKNLNGIQSEYHTIARSPVVVLFVLLYYCTTLRIVYGSHGSAIYIALRYVFILRTNVPGPRVGKGL